MYMFNYVTECIHIQFIILCLFLYFIYIYFYMYMFNHVYVKVLFYDSQFNTLKKYYK